MYHLTNILPKLIQERIQNVINADEQFDFPKAMATEKPYFA